jgi:hypothetical protein
MKPTAKSAKKGKTLGGKKLEKKVPLNSPIQAHGSPVGTFKP